MRSGIGWLWSNNTEAGGTEVRLEESDQARDRGHAFHADVPDGIIKGGFAWRRRFFWGPVSSAGAGEPVVTEQSEIVVRHSEVGSIRCIQVRRE